MLSEQLLQAEWLESDGLGGYASGTIGGTRTRRYHAVLLCATHPPTGRLVLANGFDAWVELAGQSYPISAQSYLPNVVHPDGRGYIRKFGITPWPTWTYEIPEIGVTLTQELFVCKDKPRTVLRWRVLGEAPTGLKLTVRPHLSGRDYHDSHGGNDQFRQDAAISGDRVAWHPYELLPQIHALSNGSYTQEPHWYRNFLYEKERLRGLVCNEDLASPGYFQWSLETGEAVLILAAAFGDDPKPLPESGAVALAEEFDAVERARREAFESDLHRAGDAYIVKRGKGKTILAGYPWFSDWGRDTFIAMRGLCLATGHYALARDILVEWAGTVSEGMLPNRFTDYGEQPDLNSVDSSLWFVVVVREFLDACDAGNLTLSHDDREALHAAVLAILKGYRNGTRYRIKMADDGLIACGEPGSQLTWMDAKVGDWVVTPRIGKPVEIQALWINALDFGARLDDEWGTLRELAPSSFRKRFWNEHGNYLFDVVDVDHQPGAVDAAFRPNQLFAIGGLPLQLLDGEQAKLVIEAAEAQLYTPVGMRSLSPQHPSYIGVYQGGVLERDGAYHQGTVWPWLIGSFVEAWVRVRGNTAEARAEGREKFLPPLQQHRRAAGLGHLSEIADGNAPHRPRGCPFQAWSLGELLRLQLQVLA